MFQKCKEHLYQWKIQYEGDKIVLGSILRDLP